MRSFFVVLLALVASSCREAEAKRPAFEPPRDSVLLPIPDRQWAEGAPDEGWCGEASIQMVALHYGAWVPQPMANALGHSTHVDLWEEDVPVALGKLGLAYERFPGGSLDAFLAWIISQVRAGVPVIVGAKIMPSDHPDWDVDHLMPVVGFSPTSLVLNTNMEDGQQPVSLSELRRHPTSGISFDSPTGKFYGFAVKGFADGKRAQLRVVGESRDEVSLELVSKGASMVEHRELDGGVNAEALPGSRVTVRASTMHRVR